MPTTLKQIRARIAKKRSSELVNIYRYHVAVYKPNPKPTIKESLFNTFHSLGEIMVCSEIDDFIKEGLKIVRK